MNGSVTSRGLVYTFGSDEIGDLSACSLTALAGLVGCGVCQQRVSEGLPSGSGVGQGGKDDGRFDVKIVLTFGRCVVGSGFLVTAVAPRALSLFRPCSGRRRSATATTRTNEQ
jgi:hypothetical protein